MAVIKEIDLHDPPKKGKIMPDRIIAIPGATLAPGVYEFGPYDADADVDDLSLSIDVSNHRNASVEFFVEFFTSYDGSNPLALNQDGTRKGQHGGQSSMRGGDLIIDRVQTNFFPITVGFDSLQPKNRRKVGLEIKVIGGSVILGNSEVKSSKVAVASVKIG